MNVRHTTAVDIPAVVGHFIGGEERHEDSRPKPVTNPATGEIVRRVGMATQDAVRDAVCTMSSNRSSLMTTGSPLHRCWRSP